MKLSGWYYQGTFGVWYEIGERKKHWGGKMVDEWAARIGELELALTVQIKV
jgi:hypothetical protein